MLLAIATVAESCLTIPMTAPSYTHCLSSPQAVFRFNDMLRLSCLDPDSPNAVLCEGIDGVGDGGAATADLDVDLQVKAQDERSVLLLQLPHFLA